MIPCGIPYIYGTPGGADKNIIPDAPLEANKVDLLVGKASKIDTGLINAAEIAISKMKQ